MSEPCTKDKMIYIAVLLQACCSVTVTALYNRRSYEFGAMADIHKKIPGLNG